MGSLQSWEQTVFEKQSQRDRALKPYMVSNVDQRPPRVHQVQDRSCLQDDPLAQEITEIDNIRSLVDCLGARKFTAEQVVLAYIKR